MIKNKNAFSLIEVVIATSIITITVFWVYKLIWENTKIINNSWNILQVRSIFPVLQECIENIGFSTYIQSIWQQYNFNFWSWMEECNIGLGNIVEIDNLEYIIKWEVMNFWSDYIDWELSIKSDETKTITWSYKQIDK